MKKAALETSREKSVAVAEQQKVVCVDQYLPLRIRNVCCKQADITSRTPPPGPIKQLTICWQQSPN
jgi:hypothetical protein